MKVHSIREPLQIVVATNPPRLDSDLESEVQALWEIETKRCHGALFNGNIFSVHQFESSRINGCFVEYRWLAAQRHRPNLFERLNVQPLAVSGIVESPDGIIFGRRDQQVSSDAGKWELVPSGGIDSGARGDHALVDYMRQFFDELSDEVGIDKSDIFDPVAFSMIEDSRTHVFDLGIRGRTNLRAAQINETFSRSSREYSNLKIVSRSAIQKFVHDDRDDIVPISIALLEVCGLLP